MKQKYLVLVVFCGNFCVLFYDTAIYQHHIASVRNQCNMSLNCYILVRSVVLCYIGHKLSVSVNSRTLILVIQCYMFWFNEPSFVEPKHVALDGNIIVLCVTNNYFVFNMDMMYCPSDADRRRSKYSDRKLSDCYCATLPTVTLPLYRLSLCHFTGFYCATLPTVTVPLYRLTLCHFTDCHSSTLPFVPVPLY